MEVYHAKKRRLSIEIRLNTLREFLRERQKLIDSVVKEMTKACQTEEEIEQLLLYDVTGTLVYQIMPSTNQYTLDVSKLKNGIYILHAETKSGVYRNKIIKE